MSTTPTITLEQLRHLATLTWLTLSPEEEQRYMHEFEGILWMISKLESVEIDESQYGWEEAWISDDASIPQMEADQLRTGVKQFENVDMMLDQVPVPVENRHVKITTSTNA